MSPYAAMFGREGRRPSASMLSKRPSPYMWSLEHWIDQLPHYLRKMWQVVKENAQRVQKAQAKQYDKNKKGHKLQVGERVLWFRLQDLSGDDRKFALPYIGPYIVTELKGLNNVFIRLENSTQEPFLVNVDQLSRCYAGLSMEGPLQFSHTTKPCSANRGRKARLKENTPQPSHQMTLRQTQDLNFDGNASNISRCAITDLKCIEVACDEQEEAKLLSGEEDNLSQQAAVENPSEREGSGVNRDEEEDRGSVSGYEGEDETDNEREEQLRRDLLDQVNQERELQEEEERAEKEKEGQQQ
ncbi:MAG: hypothetical protein GY820_20995 [Gammaproteobacteria bacterium]|nr:hypothetical protein [Gammaproteobacteria bacterium]